MKLLVYFERSGDKDKEGKAGNNQEKDQAEELNTNREEKREEELAAQEVEDNVEMARGDWQADSEGRIVSTLSNIL